MRNAIPIKPGRPPRGGSSGLVQVDVDRSIVEICTFDDGISTVVGTGYGRAHGLAAQVFSRIGLHPCITSAAGSVSAKDPGGRRIVGCEIERAT